MCRASNFGIMLRLANEAAVEKRVNGEMSGAEDER